jgi:lipoprotein-anchoring transpeptidase ErfK/SrfK
VHALDQQGAVIARYPATMGSQHADLSKPHYGIHGTPEPSTIGKTQPHGCIRLTNRDSLALADAIAPGAPVILQE